MDLQNPEQKMSKSEENDKGVVFIADSDKQILKKVKSAVTDSGSEILFSDAQPGIKNLLTIQSSLTGKSPEELQTSYEGKQYGQLKVETAEIVLEALRPIREKSQNYLSDRGELDRILATGAERASKRAARTLKAVYEAIGFIAN